MGRPIGGGTLGPNADTRPRVRTLGPARAVKYALTDPPAVCTPVKNQAQCGSCWAFSAVENFESRRAMTGQSDPLRQLAPQQYVDCGVQSFGCRGGWPFWGWADDVKAQQGQLEAESQYPYTARDGTCAFAASPSNAAFGNYTVLSSPTGQDGAPAYLSEDQAIAALVNYGPLSVCVDASRWSLYHSGVMSDSDCGGSAGRIDHCVQLVAYDDASFTIRNSWGESWGEQGHIRIARGTANAGTCLMLSSIQTVEQVTA